MRWNIREGGQLVCQLEQDASLSLQIIVAQEGGFAGTEPYMWMWVELDREGEFLREPFFVDGSWREALLVMLMPSHQQAGFLLGGGSPATVLRHDPTALEDHRTIPLLEGSVSAG